MSKKTFVFYRDWYEYIEQDIEQESLRLKLYQAIPTYVFTGQEPEDVTVKVIFGFIRRQLDRDSSKYDEICKKRTEAINKRWKDFKDKQDVEKNTNDTNVFKSIEKNTNDTNRTDNVNENDNENDNVGIINDTYIFKSPSKEEDSLQSNASNSAHIHYSEFVKLWNESIRGTGHHSITDIKEGTQRRAWVSARVKEYGEEAVKQVIRNASSSAFLSGSNNKGSIYGFDWVMRPNNFPKVLEGNYNDKPATPTGSEAEPSTMTPAPLSPKQKKEQEQRKFLAWCKANGVDPQDKDAGIAYFNQNINH